MKVNWNNKYTTIAIYTMLVIFSSILLFLGISNIKVFGETLENIVSIAQPFIIGGVLAYLLNYILNFYENWIKKCEICKKLSRKSVRGLAIGLTYITAGILFIIFVRIIFPQLIESIVGLANTIPQYVSENTTKFTEMFSKIDIPESYTGMIMDKWNEFVTFIINIISNAAPTIANAIVGITSSILNIIIGIIVSIYILIDKEKFMWIGKKICYSIFEERYVKNILLWIRRSNNIFGNFIGGKILDSVIIGILTFVVMIVLKMPYALLVSVIIGVTNVIPVFGPFIGAIPCFIIILFVSPTQALWFLVAILVIQQLDGNVIGPYILGDSVGLSAFWILFSVIVFSKFFGIVGMIIGVPIFAIFYAIIKELVESSLLKKGLPLETTAYSSEFEESKNAKDLKEEKDTKE